MEDHSLGGGRRRRRGLGGESLRREERKPKAILLRRLPFPLCAVCSHHRVHQGLSESRVAFQNNTLHKSLNRGARWLYLPRPAMPSSVGSDERCGKAAFMSAGACTEPGVLGGWGLRRPVRLSWGVAAAGATSPDLIWGFTWFLLGGGGGKGVTTCLELAYTL